MDEYTTAYLLYKITYDFFRVYFFQVIQLILLLYLLFSGNAKRIINRVLTARKLKAGPIEVIDAEETENSKNHPHGCASVCQKKESCANHSELAKLCEQNSIGIANLLARDEKMEKHISELWIGQLKRGFYSKDMPLAERLFDGLRYVSQGHNGEVRKDVIEAARENLDVYRILVRLEPACVLAGVEDM